MVLPLSHEVPRGDFAPMFSLRSGGIRFRQVEKGARNVPAACFFDGRGMLLLHRFSHLPRKALRLKCPLATKFGILQR